MLFNRTGRLIETLEYLLVLSVKILISRSKFEFWNSVYQEPVLLCLVPTVHRTVVRKQSNLLHSALHTAWEVYQWHYSLLYVLLHMQSYCIVLQCRVIVKSGQQFRQKEFFCSHALSLSFHYFPQPCTLIYLDLFLSGLGTQTYFHFK